MSRYIPFVQQPYCCVPASLLMVMYRHGFPLVEQEDLAYALGLTVPEEDVRLFKRARSGEKPSSGYGTQIQDSKYEINSVLAILGIPLSIECHTEIKTENELRNLLESVQTNDSDALLCFDYGKLWDNDTLGGHVCVFDQVEGDIVHIVDPERNVPKHREVELNKLFKAIEFHGAKNMAGVWMISKNEI